MKLKYLSLLAVIFTFTTNFWNCKNNDTNSIPAGMVYVAGGTLTTSSTFLNISTKVTIGKFYIDKYLVTFELWTDVRNWGLAHGYKDLPAAQNGYNPIGSNNLVSNVNWYDVVKWCNARSEMNGLTPVYYADSSRGSVYRTGQININVDAVNWTANGFSLPTECEWEFAARGGNKTHGYIYSGSDSLDLVGWYNGNSNKADNSDDATHAVGLKQANELGIYDMSGTAWEWCWDWYDNSGRYPSGGTTDPKGPSTEQVKRVLRGGSYCNGCVIYCKIDSRFLNYPSVPGPWYSESLPKPDGYGFRCVRH